MIGSICDHLWQSTLFAAGAGLLTLFFRGNGAGVRYGLWLSASLKFLFPLATLTAVGNALSRVAPAPLPTPLVMTAFDGAAQPFSNGATAVVQAQLVPVQPYDWATTLAVIWLTGFLAIVALWLWRWLGLRAIARAASPLAIAAPLPVKSSPSLLEPGLVGIFHPVLLLPTAIAGQLSAAELDTVIAHELCHWRRRDNLTALLHMLVEALFWFHPLVWWLETRLIAERERACDEAVLAQGRAPELYAQSILKICKYYVRAPLACASGISGADLKARLERIVKNPVAARLGHGKRLILALAGAITLLVPVLTGLLGSQAALAQATADEKMAPAATASPARVALPVPPAGKARRASTKRACALRQPVRPFPMGRGTVVGVESQDVAEAVIARREARLGGVIDPAYLHDRRATVRQDNGRTQDFDILPGMTVRISDRVSLQNSYRSTAASCAYVPILIIADNSALQNSVQTADQAATQSGLLGLPAGIRTLVNRHNRVVLGHDLPITITLLAQPAHGTVTTDTGTVTEPTYSGPQDRTVTQVFYQSEPGYTGPDGFTYKRTSPDPADPLNSRTYTIRFAVK